MIDVNEVIKRVPHLEKFYSVDELHRIVEELRSDPRFCVSVPGVSSNGVPIHQVRIGAGSVKALFLGGPHAMEPMGSMVVASLLRLLQHGNPDLIEADVEWHIVPCIDPDGALLNEGWSQSPFTLDSYMRNYYLQAMPQQVDATFPISYKKLSWMKTSTEAEVLRGILDRVRPDFFFPLHHAWTGGAFYFLSRDIGGQHYERIYWLLEEQGVPLQKRPIWKEVCEPFADGIVEMFNIKKHYDYLEKTVPDPQQRMAYGAASWDYLAEIKPEALTFVAEVGYVRHPDDESEAPTGENFRRFKLRTDADSKYLATVLREEWAKVKEDVDSGSPFFKLIAAGRAVPGDEQICEGASPLSRYPMRDVMFNPEYDRMMTEGDRFDACMVNGGFMFLRDAYQFMRLLKTSRCTPAVSRAIERLEREFDSALGDLKRHVDFGKFEPISCDALAKVQLGSGLIVLNSLLESRC